MSCSNLGSVDSLPGVVFYGVKCSTLDFGSLVVDFTDSVYSFDLGVDGGGL